MTKNKGIFLFVICAGFVLTQCVKKGKAIVEPRFGTFKFTTYTVDTFRFRVVINEEVLTDSLLSPQSNLSRQVNFFDTPGTLKITDTKTGQVILDSVIQMRIGLTTISIVQFASGERPFIPQPPNEPLPATGNYKIRFQYVRPSNPAVPYFDSIRCLVRKSGVYVDTIVLEKNQSTGFYEAASNNSFVMRLEDPLTNTVLNTSTNSVGLNFTGFNTAIIDGSQAPTPVSPSNPYRYRLIRVY